MPRSERVYIHRHGYRPSGCSGSQKASKSAITMTTTETPASYRNSCRTEFGRVHLSINIAERFCSSVLISLSSEFAPTCNNSRSLVRSGLSKLPSHSQPQNDASKPTACYADVVRLTCNCHSTRSSGCYNSVDRNPLACWLCQAHRIEVRVCISHRSPHGSTQNGPQRFAIPCNWSK